MEALVVTKDDRFWKKVTRGAPDECWEWRGAKTRGYGYFGRGSAYRWLYEHERGPVPEGQQLDHLCRNRACVNPAHLEPVTRKVNILRGVCPAADNAKKTHCPKGHPLSGDNVKLKKQSGGRPGFARACVACNRERDKKRHAGGPGRGYFERTEQARANISEAQRKRFARPLTVTVGLNGQGQIIGAWWNREDALKNTNYVVEIEVRK